MAKSKLPSFVQDIVKKSGVSNKDAEAAWEQATAIRDAKGIKPTNAGYIPYAITIFKRMIGVKAPAKEKKAQEKVGEYIWYRYVAPRGTKLKSAKSEIMLREGAKFGVKSASKDKMRVVTEELGPKVIFTYDTDKVTLLISKAKATKAKIKVTASLDPDEDLDMANTYGLGMWEPGHLLVKKQHFKQIPNGTPLTTITGEQHPWGSRKLNKSDVGPGNCLSFGIKADQYAAARKWLQPLEAIASSPYEICAKMKVLKDADAIKTMVKMYNAWIDENNMSEFFDFAQDLDDLFVKYRGDKPLKEEEVKEFTEGVAEQNEEKEAEEEEKQPAKPKKAKKVEVFEEEPVYDTALASLIKSRL